MLKHVGYAVVDSMGNIYSPEYLVDPSDIEGVLQMAIKDKEYADMTWTKRSPHKIARVFIDDEAVIEQ